MPLAYAYGLYEWQYVFMVYVQHDGFLDAECWGRNRMIDKFGQKTDKSFCTFH